MATSGNPAKKSSTTSDKAADKAAAKPAKEAPETAPADEDELHRKFREALEHKHGGGGTGGKPTGDSGKAHGASGPAQQQRMFRRKSGG
jgi:hypothetical protein